MKDSRGSITIYLCLTLTIILSLFTAMLKSIRTAGGRAMIASAMDQGLFSLFAQYDKDLLEEYDLFYIDGGFGSDSLQMKTLYEMVRHDALDSLDPYGHGNRNFFGADFVSGSITGYILATDQTGNSFVHQVSEHMKSSLVTSGIQDLSNTLNTQDKQMDSQLTQIKALIKSDPISEYDREINASAPLQSDEPPEATPAKIDHINPIELIKNIRKSGALGLVVADPDALSPFKIDSFVLPSSRSLNQGMGVLPAASSNETDRLMMLEYIMDKFPNYTSSGHTDGLSCQVEYVIAGKDTDTENLKSVVNQLLKIRQVSNLIYLCSSQEKKAQIDLAATGISSSLLIPVAQPVLSLALLYSWAYVESISDVRGLLAGQNAPLIKTDSCWKISLEGITSFLSSKEIIVHSNSEGFDYNWYLRFLLFKQSQKTLTMAAMDLVEYNMNLKNPNKSFRIDNCVESMEMESEWEIDHSQYKICRKYGYQ